MGNWEKQGSTWQYRESGVLSTSWTLIDGKWYLFDAAGNMKLGWQKEKDRWYYLKQAADRKSAEAKNDYGYTLTGWQQLDGKWYYFGSDGSMQLGWQKIKERWYYLKQESDRKAGEAKNAYGFMLTGWQQINGKWFFFHEDGSMAVYEWVKDKGKWYFLRSNGEMARNQMRSYKGKSYYFKADGSMAVSEAVSWNGERYRADRDGVCLEERPAPGGHNVSRLHPRLKRLQKKLIAQCAARGLPIRITQEVRTAEEQDALYALGRTAGGSIVTNARGSSYSSHHQWGTAFDFCRDDGKLPYENGDRFFEKVGAMGKALGLEWGGDWKSIVDMPHFQLPDWGSGTAKLKELYVSPDRFEKTWET